MLRSTDTLRDVTSTSGGAIDTGMLSVSPCEQVVVWFIATGAAAPTGCTVSLCDVNGRQMLSVPVTVAIGGSTPVFAGAGIAPGVANAVALGPVPPRLFASGAGGAASTLRIVVLGLPRASFQPADDPTPLIIDDANTVAHVWWRDGTGLVDTKGNSWTINGAVPQVARIVTGPAGAGPFSDANYYSLGAGNDVLDFAGDFSACLVFSATSVAGAPARVLFSNGAANVSGYYIQQRAVADGDVSLALNAAAANLLTTAPGAPILAGPMNVLCFGRTGTSGAIKANGGAYTTGAGPTITPATTTVAALGKYSAAGNPASTDTIYEAWFSTTAPSDALFTAIMQNVKSRLGITAW